MSEPHFVDSYVLDVTAYVWDKYKVQVVTVSKGSLKEDMITSFEDGSRVASLPLFMSNGGMIRRQCTNEYKIDPINKYIRSELDIGRKTKDSIASVNRMFGISLDEIERCKVSQDWWAVNKYPLVDHRIYRHEVIDYVNNNHPDIANPPRSSCYFCPFHSNDYWSAMKKKHPEMFEDACKMDDVIRVNKKLEHECFLHRSLIPLRDISFDNPQMEIFGECEGYCGI